MKGGCVVRRVRRHVQGGLGRRRVEAGRVGREGGSVAHVHPHTQRWREVRHRHLRVERPRHRHLLRGGVSGPAIARCE